MKRRNFFKWSLAAIGIGSIPEPVDYIIYCNADSWDGFLIFDDNEKMYCAEMAKHMANNINLKLATRWCKDDIIPVKIWKVERSEYGRD